MIIQPINNYVVVRLDKADEKIGSLYTAGTLQEKFAIPKRTGTILAVGRGLITAGGHTIPPQIKPGDRVLVAENVQRELTVDYDGAPAHILSGEESIIGIIQAETSLLVAA